MHSAWIRQNIREPFCGLSHLAGAALAIAATVALLVLAEGRFWHVVGLTVYGASLIVLYATSGLAHSLQCRPSSNVLLHRLDHAAIFLLIAGTYTPLCLIALRGPWGWSLFSVEWLLASVGAVSVLSGRPRSRYLRTSVYILMGWLAVVATPAICAAVPAAGVRWLIAGGVVYTVGAVVYATGRPVLWPGSFGSHDLWHCFVLGGSACHFVAIARYVA